MPLRACDPARLTMRERSLLAHLAPYLDRAERLDMRQLAAVMDYRAIGGVSFYLARLHRAGLVVRIATSTYVRPGDPRIPAPGAPSQPAVVTRAPARGAIAPPAMVPGLTLARLMAGR